MKLLYKLLVMILILGSMICVWFLLANLQPIQPALYAFAMCLVAGVYLTFRLLNRTTLVVLKKGALRVTKQKHFTSVTLLCVTLFGILARIFFYYKFSYVPTSDPMTFYTSASKLAAGGGQLGNVYVAFQPYLSAYNNILGAAMKVVADPWLSTILLNTAVDTLSALVLYVLLKKILKHESLLPLVAFSLWTLSPLNIIFSVLSLPVIIVNFFIILTILTSYILIQQITSLKTKSALLASLILGLGTGAGNCFRPIFSVAIIALAILCVFMFFTTNKSTKFLKVSLMCIIASSLVFIGIQFLNIAFVSHQTGLRAAKNPSGWSMYVGSDIETSGEWRPFQNDEMGSICKDSLARGNYDLCHAQLRKVAIARYESYGLPKSASLFIRKLYHQAGHQNYFYNAEQSITGYSQSRTFKVINNYMIIYMTALFLLSAFFLYNLARRAAINKLPNPILILTALILIGWFFLFMFTESAPRYSTILYPIFILFSVLSLDSGYRVIRKNSRQQYR